MIYQVIFDQFTLDYEIIDSPVSRIWSKLVLQAQDNGCEISKNRWITCWPNQEYIDKLWNKIEQLSSQHNLLVTRAQQSLNELHKEFHLRGETSNDTELEELNTSIHLLEHALRLIDIPDRWNSQVGFYLESAETVSLDKELCHYWNYNPNNNDLCLGYHTIGKNLYQCWRDKDIQLIRDNMMRPQITISTEVNLVFTRGNPILDDLELLSKRINFWVKHNQLDRCIDTTDIYNQFHGAPLLGKYVGSVSNESINLAFQNGAKLIKAVLTK
jgi:hypothetical protein